VSLAKTLVGLGLAWVQGQPVLSGGGFGKSATAGIEESKGTTTIYTALPLLDGLPGALEMASCAKFRNSNP